MHCRITLPSRHATLSLLYKRHGCSFYVESAADDITIITDNFSGRVEQLAGCVCVCVCVCVCRRKLSNDIIIRFYSDTRSI